MPVDPDMSIEAAAQALAKASRVSVFSGAGMSAESGILTFRDPEVGIWKNKLLLLCFGTPYGWNWLNWTGLAWKNYKRFHDPIFAAKPNAGHFALAEIPATLQLAPDAVQIATQNVDYLHQRAGSPKELVFEVHGSIFRHRCIAKGHPMAIPVDAPLPPKQPRCAVCGSGARPDATLFTENLPEDQFAGALKAMHRLRKGDVLFVIGTSGEVYPAAGLPDEVKRGVVKIELNAAESKHTPGMDIFVKGGSAVTLPRILARAKEIKGL